VNRAEVAELLTVIASFDRRTLDDPDVIAWHAVLRDEHLADCREAVVRHYAEKTDWIMPAHVRKGARMIRRERMAALDKYAPDADPDDPQAYIRALRDGRRRTTEGQRSLPPIGRVFRAIEGGS